MDEDKKLIYEFCGWRYSQPECSCSICSANCWIAPDAKILHGEPVRTIEPALDPNFYFKEAVPALESISISGGRKIRWLVILELNVDERAEAFDNDLAEAFGQALVKLIKDKK